MAIIAAILSGTTIVISRMVNAVLGEKIGVYLSTFFNYLLGLIVSIIIVLFLNIKFDNFFIPVSIDQFVIYLGGFVGVFAVGLASYVSPKISAFKMTLLTFVSQLFFSIAIDYIFLGQMPGGKAIGGILIFIGLAFNMNIDRKYELENL